MLYTEERLIPATCKSAWIVFHELFKSIFVQLLIFHVKILMFLHVGFVFESKLTT